MTAYWFLTRKIVYNSNPFPANISILYFLKASENQLTFLTPWYAHVGVRISGSEMLGGFATHFWLILIW